MANQTTVIAPKKVDLYRDRGMPNTLMTLSGVATFSRAKFFSWTARFIILGGGRGAGTLSTAGYYDIRMPAVGTVIQGVGGAANVTVTAAGIDMRQAGGNWTNLYYILPAGGAGTDVANFRLVTYSADFVIPDNWVLVFAYNPDAFTVKLGNGQIVKEGGDSTGAVLPFDATIDFNQLTPTTPGVTFSPNTPANGAVLYVSRVNGSQWTYNGSTYITVPAAQDWKTAGNAGTVQATNFLGTVDNVGLSIRTNNVIRKTITGNGNEGINQLAPTNKLHVNNAGFNPNANDLASIKVEGSYGGGIAFAEGANRALIWSDSGRTLSFSTGGTAAGTPERMRVTETGNLVINGTSGTEKLHVNGNIRVNSVPIFATTALAIASALPAGTMYTVTVGGAKQLFIK
jgi:hypothetical protein